MTKTEFTDKAGQSIYIGDIVQRRLGTFGKKSGGLALFEVYYSKKQGVCIRSLRLSMGHKLREADCKYLVIVDKSGREGHEQYV